MTQSSRTPEHGGIGGCGILLSVHTLSALSADLPNGEAQQTRVHLEAEGRRGQRRGAAEHEHEGGRCQLAAPWVRPQARPSCITSCLQRHSLVAGRRWAPTRSIPAGCRPSWAGRRRHRGESRTGSDTFVQDRPGGARGGGMGYRWVLLALPGETAGRGGGVM